MQSGPFTFTRKVDASKCSVQPTRSFVIGIRSHRSPPRSRSSQAPAGDTARGYSTFGGYHATV